MCLQVVDMRPFRGLLHWKLWLLVEKSFGFMCMSGQLCQPDARSTHGIGDAPFRGYSLPFLITDPKQVLSLKTALSYRHPVAGCSASDYGPVGQSGGAGVGAGRGKGKGKGKGKKKNEPALYGGGPRSSEA